MPDCNCQTTVTVELGHPLSEDDWEDVISHLRWLAHKFEQHEYRSQHKFTLHERQYVDA